MYKMHLLTSTSMFRVLNNIKWNYSVKTHHSHLVFTLIQSIYYYAILLLKIIITHRSPSLSHLLIKTKNYWKLLLSSHYWPYKLESWNERGIQSNHYILWNNVKWWLDIIQRIDNKYVIPPPGWYRNYFLS